MFADDIELEQMMAPTISPISPDTISSMPKPPTISETIFRLHQNLSSSIEKPKDKKRKKKPMETSIPSHLEHHLYARPSPCVSSCAQPSSNPNYGYFTPFLLNDSHVSQKSESLPNGMQSNRDPKSSPTPMPSKSLSAPNPFMVKPFGTSPVSMINEFKTHGDQKPPNLVPYNLDMSGRESCYFPPSHPPLLKPPDFPLMNFINENCIAKEAIKKESSLTMEASTSTDDLNRSQQTLSSNSSIPLNAANLTNVSLRVIKLYKIA